MQSNLTREQALALLKTYNKEPFHIQHALTVETLKTGPRSTAGKPRSCSAPPAWART